MKLGDAQAVIERLLGKRIVYVEDPEETPESRGRYLEMIRSSADYCCPSLVAGLKILQEMLEQGLVR